LTPQALPEFVAKIVQIFDCKVARHGNMIVGQTGAGKSEAWRCLARAMARLRREGHEDPRFQKVSRGGQHSAAKWLKGFLCGLTLLGVVMAL
jgi:energy-coupling factor transporter ATP-binding protein EcfA2